MAQPASNETSSPRLSNPQRQDSRIGAGRSRSVGSATSPRTVHRETTGFINEDAVKVVRAAKEQLEQMSKKQ